MGPLMKEQIEKYILDVIEERRPAPLTRGVLSILSTFFQTAVRARNWGYDKRIFKRVRASLPVVSIGNIAAGGTGKTPLIHLLAKELGAEKRVAILTRGYRGDLKGNSLNISALEPAEAKRYGDEPFWLSHKLPEASVWVGKDRVRSAELAAQKNATLLLLDDGMQYRALERDFEIVILDGKDLFAKGAFLPKGLLRDDPKRLKQADLIVINHVYDTIHYGRCLRQLAPYTSAPVAAMRYSFKETEFLKGKKVGAFCALGRPERFLELLRLAGCTIIDDLIALDHRPFDERQLKAFAERCKQRGADLLVCTEKDAVKLPRALELSLPIKSLEVEIQWTAGQADWQECIKKIVREAHE
ncbi:MAG: tetraacyldisaccharide 4'-kinase [Chlamydiales bacterium]|nr:tetraacyldisaccharide 4'-kinase [Chlamydiales bacterium]